MRRIVTIAVLGVFLLVTGGAKAWVTGVTSAPEPGSQNLRQSIERDGKGDFLIAYVKKGTYPNYYKKVMLKYYNGSTWVEYEVFDVASDFYDNTNYSLQVFECVSLAVRHDSTENGDVSTDICVAAAIDATHTASDKDRVTFVYAEFELSSTGTLTAVGGDKTITSNLGYGSVDSANALYWFDSGSCHSQPSPANNRYYGDGDNFVYYANRAGMIRAAYSGDTLWFACAVSGFVDHTDTDSSDPANVYGYRYEEHQALYLFETTGSGWAPYLNNTDSFQFEACEIVNADFTPVFPNWQVHLAADNTADVTDEDTWILSYREIDFTGSNDGVCWAVVDDATSPLYPVSRRQVIGALDTYCETGQGAKQAPHVVVWEGHPYLIHNEWYERTLDPSCSYASCNYKGYIVVEPFDNSGMSGLGVGSFDPSPYYHCTTSPAALFNEITLQYVGISGDGTELRIIQGAAGYGDFVGTYKVEGLQTVSFDSSDLDVTYVKEDIEYGQNFFGDRVAVQSDGKGAFLFDEGEEDRRGDIDYFPRVAEE